MSFLKVDDAFMPCHSTLTILSPFIFTAKKEQPQDVRFRNAVY